MEKREALYPSGPIFVKIGKARGAKAEFASRLGVSQAVVSNWIKRGIPARMLGEVLHAAEMSPQEYQKASGLPERRVTMAFVGPSPSFNRLAKAFLSLPKGLQEYLIRKSEELLAYSEAIPSLYRESLNPPDDTEEYWNWERQVRQDIKDKLAATRPSRPPSSHPKKR